MSVTMPWGGTYQVLMQVGFIVRKFTLETSTLDGSDVLDGTLEGVDVTEYVQELTINRGRTDNLQDFNAGTCTVVLNNNDRRFDPSNTASPYIDPATNLSGVVPRRKIEVKYGSTSLFTGRIIDIDIEYSPQPQTLSTVTVKAADDFVRAASTTISAHTPSAELSGARISNILDRAEVNYPATRNISAGTTTLGAYPIAANKNTLDYLQDIARTEQGYLYVAGNGNLTFTDRVTTAFAAPAATFADDGTGIKYSVLGIQYGDEFLFNQINCVNATEVISSASDATSQTTFGTSVLTVNDLLFASDTDAANLATFLLGLYKDPEYRFDKVRIDFAGANISTADQATVVGLDLGSNIRVKRTFSTGTPLAVQQDVTIQRIEHSISPIAHSIKLSMSPARIIYQFTLDSSTRGTLDADNALA